MADLIPVKREARRVEVRWCYGEVAKVSGATDEAAAIVSSLVDGWAGSWSDLLDHAERLGA